MWLSETFIVSFFIIIIGTNGPKISPGLGPTNQIINLEKLFQGTKMDKTNMEIATKSWSSSFSFYLEKNFFIMKELSSSSFSIELITTNTTNMTNPTKCLRQEFIYFFFKKIIKLKKNIIKFTYVQMFRVSLCQEKTLRQASFNGHSHL